MPRLNEKGPMGYGPQTGKGLGSCNNFQNSGNSNVNGRGAGRGNGRCRGFGGGQGLGRGNGQGLGRGNGQGFGRGNGQGCSDTQLSRQDEKQLLLNQMNTLQDQLNSIRQKLEKFEIEESSESEVDK